MAIFCGASHRVVVLLLVLALSQRISQPALAEESDGLRTLRRISQLSKANRERIRTWSGHETIVKTWQHTEKSRPAQQLDGFRDIVKQHREIEVEFAYDAASGNLRSNYRIQKNVNIHSDGRKSSFLEVDSHTLIKDGVCFIFRPFPHERVGITTKAGELQKPVTTTGRSIRRAVRIEAETPRDLRDPIVDFFINPVDRIYPSQNAKRMVENRYAYLKGKGTSDTEGILVDQEGQIVTLRVGTELSFDRYRINLAKGAAIIHLEKFRNEELAEEWRLEPQLVSGVWIPRRTTRYELGLQTGRVVNTQTEWFDNVINEPIEVSEFSLVKMDVCRGDKIIDTRINGSPMSRVIGDEFPPPPPPPHEEGYTYKGLWRRALVVLGAVLFVAATIVFWYRRRET